MRAIKLFLSQKSIFSSSTRQSGKCFPSDTNWLVSMFNFLSQLVLLRIRRRSESKTLSFSHGRCRICYNFYCSISKDAEDYDIRPSTTEPYENNDCMGSLKRFPARPPTRHANSFHPIHNFALGCQNDGAQENCAMFMYFRFVLNASASIRSVIKDPTTPRGMLRYRFFFPSEDERIMTETYDAKPM
jgi:hypothetical protein